MRKLATGPNPIRLVSEEGGQWWPAAPIAKDCGRAQIRRDMNRWRVNGGEEKGWARVYVSRAKRDAIRETPDIGAQVLRVRTPLGVCRVLWLRQLPPHRRAE